MVTRGRKVNYSRGPWWLVGIGNLFVLLLVSTGLPVIPERARPFLTSSGRFRFFLIVCCGLQGIGGLFGLLVPLRDRSLDERVSYAMLAALGVVGIMLAWFCGVPF